MAINAEQTFSLDLSLFGSKVSDLSPGNLPAGVSPDNSNCFFFPQGVSSRPAYIHALASGFGEVSVMSHSRYTPPGGFYGMVGLDSALNLWQYDVEDGTPTKLFTLSPWGNDQKYFSGVQLFDKFFMAFFDPLNGLNQFSSAADVPRYINTLGHCNRVTIDGPGGGLSIENVNLEGLFQNHQVATGFVRSGNLVTVTLNSYEGNYPLDPFGHKLLPVPGWFIQMYDADALSPTWNYSNLWNTTTPLNSCAVQATGPGSTTAGNILTVYYRADSGGSQPDPYLVAAFQAAQAGGYTLYVLITNPALGPAGIFPVTQVALTGQGITPLIPNGHGGISNPEESYYYFSYQVPGPASFIGVGDIPPSTTATYSISTASLTPDQTNINGSGMFTNNELYQQIGGNCSISSDASGVTKVSCGEAITNLPIGGWVYLVINSSEDLPFTTGWVQVAALVDSYTFSISTPGAQLFNITGVTLFEYWGSLNTSASLVQPVPGNPVGKSYAQTGAQGFQITKVTDLGSGNVEIQWYQLGPDSTNGAGSGRMALVLQSAQSPGNRQAFCHFISEDSADSPGSPPINFTTLGGPNFTRVTFPIGPVPTVARALSVTPANGADFFCIPPANVAASGPSAAPIITQGTIIYDDTTITQYIDWSDAALVAGIPTSGPAGAGSDFGDLTSTINLPPCFGVTSYQEALVWFGEYNNIKNLLNMSFQGGATSGTDSAPTSAPPGWDNTTERNGIVPDQTAVLAEAGDNSGWQVNFPSSGTSNGLISQSAYQDVWGAPILLPNQSYTLVLRATATGDAGGQLNILIQSDATSTIYGEATILEGSMNGTTLGWISAPFFVPSTTTLATMPQNIPPDTRIVIYRSGSDANTISIADAFIVNANSPVLTNQIRFSYPDDPFGYDNENGYTAISTAPDPIVSLFKQRKYLYGLTTKDLLQTFDTGEVPAEWGFEIFAENCGGSGPNAVDSQSDVAWWLGQFGGQMFAGSEPKKVTQEMQPDFDTINWTYRSVIDVAADPIQRVIYFTAPTGLSSVSDMIFTMNHRMVDPNVNIMDPIHVSSYTGKMVATDLARKWSPWPVACNSLAMAYIENADGELSQAMTFGLGQFGPTGPDAIETTTGTTETILGTITPSNLTDVVFAAISNPESNAPAGWTHPAGISYYISPASTALLTFSTPNSVFTAEGWGCILASFQTNGTPTPSTGGGAVSGGISASTHAFGPFDVTAGNAIIVSFGGINTTGANFSVTDTQGNKYTLYQAYQSKGEGSCVMLAFALGCKGGSTTVNVTVGEYIGEGSGNVLSYSGIFGPTSTGQIYTQDFVNYPPSNPAATSWNTTDADLGTYPSFYDTYFFFAHDVEQNAMLALYRKLFCYMSTHLLTDGGDLTIIPYVDALNNAWLPLPAIPPTGVNDIGFDIEMGLNVTGNRMSLGYSMSAGGFWLTHLIVSARRDLVFPVRGVF